MSVLVPALISQCGRGKVCIIVIALVVVCQQKPREQAVLGLRVETLFTLHEECNSLQQS